MLKVLLNTYSYFSFAQACSSPGTLAKRAADLGYTHMAITDTLGVYASVELIQAAKAAGITPLIGATVSLAYADAVYPLPLLVASKQGYAALNRLITLAKERDGTLTLSQLELASEHLYCLSGGRRGFINTLLEKKQFSKADALIQALKRAFGERLYVQLFWDAYPWDVRRANVLKRFAREHRVAVVAAPEVRYATPDLMPLHDALTCARLGITLHTPHRERPQNSCQAIPDPNSLPAAFTEAAQNANRLAERLRFELLPERLEPPPAYIPDGYTSQSYLESLCRERLLEHYQGEHFSAASQRLELELYTIKSLGFAEFFLVVYEVMSYCYERGIVASGRGSAAGSIVCYLLGVTQADPVTNKLLFQRFLSLGKRAMPDIDIDIASSRRREVFDWLVNRYPNAAMVCNKMTYYLPSAVQDVGRALGLAPKVRNHLTKSLGRDFRHTRPHQVALAKEIFDEVLGEASVKDVLLALLAKIESGFVRQISPHSGGWVVSKHPLSTHSPQETSSGGLVTLQFDKDDIEALGLMKLDLLGLRMLGVFERVREEVIRTEAVYLDVYAPPEDKDVWQTIQAGDTMTLFQIESPAQVRMTVQLKPETRQDLKDQVALVRPGPIQSDSVHPYMRRRRHEEQLSYTHPALKPILERSYGVLLYQEQIMEIAHDVAGFSWEEADLFRKKMSSYEDEYEVRFLRRKFIQGAGERCGLSAEQASELLLNISAFRGFGFAESHAWAFGLHAYTSAWLRHHYPAEWFAGVMSEQPGMYNANTVRQEARRWGVGFARLDINKSSFHYFVERTSYGKRLRPPLCAVKGVSVDTAKTLILERMKRGPYLNLKQLFERVALPRDSAEALDKAGAFVRLSDRRTGLYQVGVLSQGTHEGQASLFAPEEAPPFPELSVMEQLEWDFKLKGYSEHAVHPVDLHRNRLLELGAIPFTRLRQGAQVKTAGLVIARQKPPTARGFAFWLIEDNQDRVQVVISPDLWEQRREVLRDASLMMAEGYLSRQGSSLTLRAQGVWSVS